MATFVIDFFKGTLATLLPILFHQLKVIFLDLWTLAMVDMHLSLQDLRE